MKLYPSSCVSIRLGFNEVSASCQVCHNYKEDTAPQPCMGRSVPRSVPVNAGAGLKQDRFPQRAGR
jgi:hypothetical protein